jgi:hypothetical protein
VATVSMRSANRLPAALCVPEAAFPPEHGRWKTSVTGTVSLEAELDGILKSYPSAVSSVS